MCFPTSFPGPNDKLKFDSTKVTSGIMSLLGLLTDPGSGVINKIMGDPKAAALESQCLHGWRISF